MARVARNQAVLSLRPKHRIDIERDISLPNLVKSSGFSLRRRSRPVRVGRGVAGEGDEELRAILLDQGRVKRGGQESRERSLVGQHRDVWGAIVRRCKAREEGLDGGAGVVLGRLLANLQALYSKLLVLCTLYSVLCTLY